MNAEGQIDNEELSTLPLIDFHLAFHLTQHFNQCHHRKADSSDTVRWLSMVECPGLNLALLLTSNVT